ncbi:MAG TPA: flagellar hook-length control protein FliK [bacterium]|nr:flagellar hook-length control protein FliK [bacterium]
MPDPIASPIRLTAQTALSTGLAALLKSGPVTGTVLSHQPGGKTVIAFQGQSYPLHLKGEALQSGQTVLARMTGEQISLEVMPPSKSPAPVSPPGSLSSLLATLGISGKSARALAQAFMQAGIPLDRQALREMARLLPNVSESQVSALSFLFSRGLPISPMLVQWISQILTPKPRLDSQLGGVLTRLQELLKSWDEGGGPEIPLSQREPLREALSDLVRLLPSLPDLAQESQEDLIRELEILFQNAAASPEILIQRHAGPESRSVQEAVVRLLAQLLSLQPMMEKTSQADEFTTLLNQVKILHETFAQAALQNLPPPSEPAAYPVYLQIPFREGETTRELEARYTPRQANGRSGTLDLRLDLSRLGPLLIAIQWDAPRISVSIVVTHPGIQEYLNPFIPELTEQLRERGLQVLSTGVVTGKVPETLKAEEIPVSGAMRGLDVRG